MTWTVSPRSLLRKPLGRLAGISPRTAAAPPVDAGRFSKPATAG
jgi:hypothetical protein